MKKIWLFLVVLGVCKGLGAYKESSFYFDNGKTPRAIHYTAQGFKANTTYSLKLYVKNGENETPRYLEILSKNGAWIKADEDTWQEDLPSFTTLDNGYQEGWVYVRNNGIETGTYATCAFSVKEGTSGETMKPGIFRPATIMNDCGWLEGYVYKDGKPVENGHIVFLGLDGKVLGAVDSEPNCISDDNPETPGYFKIALPGGTIVSTITDWDCNLYEIPQSQGNGIGIASKRTPQGGPWEIFAGRVTSLGYGILQASSDIVINEIMYDPQGSDENREWVEVCNIGNSSVDIANLKFVTDDTAHDLTLVMGTFNLQPGSYAVFCQATQTFLSDYPDFSGNLFDSSWSSLSNISSETLRLKDGIKIFGTVTYGPFPGVGTASEGHSLEKLLPNLLNVKWNWAPSVGTGGTPGRLNSRLAVISGTVRETGSGTLANAKVEAIVRWHGGLHYKALKRETDNNGSYTLIGLKEGTYTLVASKIEYKTGTKSVFAQGGTITNVDFYLDWVGPCPDLYITDKDIWWKPKRPKPEKRMRLFARVHNIGATQATNIDVEFWQSNWGINQDWGDSAEVTMPTIQGTIKHFLGSCTIDSLSAGASQTVSIKYTPPHFGLNNILVKVDPPINSGGNIIEQNELNNVAGRCIFIKYGTPTMTNISVPIPIGNPLGDEEGFNLEADTGNLSENEFTLSPQGTRSVTLTIPSIVGTRASIFIRAIGNRMGTTSAEVILVLAEHIQEIAPTDTNTTTGLGNFKVYIPQGAFKKAARVILNKNIDPDQLPNLRDDLKPYAREFTFEEEGTKTFNKKVKITIPLPSFINPGRARIFYLNEESEQWEMVNTTVGTDSLSAEVDHFSLYVAQEATITTIRVVPSQATIRAGGTISLQAIPYDQNGGTITGDIDFTWEISPTAGGTITKIGTDTAIGTFTKTGTYQITASTESVTGTATIIVQMGTPTQLEITLSTNTITADEVATITAIIKDEQGNTATTTALELSAENGSITNGIFYPDKVGTWEISGTYTVWGTETITGTATIVVTEGQPAKISGINRVGTESTFNINVKVTDQKDNIVSQIPVISWSIVDGSGTLELSTSTDVFNTLTAISRKVVVMATITNASCQFTVTKANGFIASGQLGSITFAIPYGTLTLEGTATTPCYIYLATSTIRLNLPTKRQWGDCFEISAYGTEGTTLQGVIGTFTLVLPVPEGALKFQVYKSTNTTNWFPISSLNQPMATIDSFSLFALGGGYSAYPNLDSVFAYPNPWKKKGGPKEIIFKKLTANATIRIFNVAGEEVDKFEHNDGSDEQAWTVPAKLASGVYIALIEGGGGKKIIKLGIIK
ncbi:MAG: lamin tail domain-containing protein [bacterium]